MYMKHRRMLYGEFHRPHYLVLDQSASDNSLLILLRHEVWNVDNKMIILIIGLCYNAFSRIFVQQQHYLKHDTVCLSILFP